MLQHLELKPTIHQTLLYPYLREPNNLTTRAINTEKPARFAIDAKREKNIALGAQMFLASALAMLAIHQLRSKTRLTS